MPHEHIRHGRESPGFSPESASNQGDAEGRGGTPTPTGNDPRYRTCGDANAAGYGPYRKGVDPEYAWYQDRDGDGLVCER